MLQTTDMGKSVYSKTRMNVLDYIAGPRHNGKPAWKDIWLSMTINSVNSTNRDSIDDVVVYVCMYTYIHTHVSKIIMEAAVADDDDDAMSLEIEQLGLSWGIFYIF